MYHEGKIVQDAVGHKVNSENSCDCGKVKNSRGISVLHPRGVEDCAYSATDKEFPFENVSWLGRWADNGWAIKIGRKLTDEDWRPIRERADETWDNEMMQYSPAKSLALLHELFPGVELTIVYPRCNKRIKTDGVTTRGELRLPIYELCDQDGVISGSLYAANGQRVTVVRCHAHAGEL